MKRVAIAIPLLLAGIFASADAYAKDAVRWVGSLEEAKAQAKDRGSLIFIAEVIDGEADNEAQKEAYRDPQFVKASRDFVCVVACPQMEHGQTKVTIDGKTVSRCRDWPDLTCEQHMKIWNEVRKNYADLNTASDGSMKVPYQFVIDANGEFKASVVNGTVEGGFGVITGPAMAQALKLIIGQFGKGLSSDEYEEMKETLAAAEKANADGDYRLALKLCLEIIKANDRTTLADRAKKIEAAIEERGRGEIERAMELAAKDPIDAVTMLEQIADDYKGTEVEKTANSRLDELRKDPKVKSALAELAARKEAMKRLEKAEALVKRGEYAKAFSIFDDIAKVFEGTSAGEKAKTRVAELRADEEIAKTAREQEAAKYCRGWISMGISFAKNRMVDKAREQFRKVIEKYPGTSFAEEAKKELEKLK